VRGRRGDQAVRRPRAADTRRTTPDVAGPVVVVAVDGSADSLDALEWAAAQASASGASLRIVRVIDGPSLRADDLGLVAGPGPDHQMRLAVQVVVDHAVQRAHAVDPALRVTTRLATGSISSAVLRERGHAAMIVLGHDRTDAASFRSATRRIVRRSGCPVTVVKLGGRAVGGPSAGRVVVDVGRRRTSAAALDAAFAAARQRAVGVTVVHQWMPWRELDRCIRRKDLQAVRRIEQAFVADVVRPWTDASPDVDVRHMLITGDPATALAAESMSAALVVIGRRRDRMFGGRRGSVRRALLGAGPVTVAVG